MYTFAFEFLNVMDVFLFDNKCAKQPIILLLLLLCFFGVKLYISCEIYIKSAKKTLFRKYTHFYSTFFCLSVEFWMFCSYHSAVILGATFLWCVGWRQLIFAWSPILQLVYYFLYNTFKVSYMCTILQ